MQKVGFWMKVEVRGDSRNEVETVKSAAKQSLNTEDTEYAEVGESKFLALPECFDHRRGFV